MSETVFKLPDFSINGGALSGALPLAELPRLREKLPQQPDAALTYRIVGGVTAGKRLFVSAELSATLSLVCQRCLQAFDCPVAARQLFWTKGGATPSAGDTDAGEEIENGVFELREFLTDELLLSLPFAPKHDEAACKARANFLS